MRANLPPIPEDTANIVRPGDKVLIAFKDNDYHPEALQEYQSTLLERFPGVEFTFAVGATVVVVPKGE